MSNIAQHMRITATQVTDQDVDRRIAAVNDLAGTYALLRSPLEILNKAAGIAVSLGGDGTPSDQLGEEVQAAVQPHASSFIYSERPLEVGICSGMAVYSMISSEPTGTGASTNADLMAAGLWSALSFQATLSEPKREALRAQVLTAAQSRVTRAAERARMRSEVPAFGAPGIVVEELEKYPAAFKRATTATIDALRRNAVLDREELDFLWYAMLDHSRLLKKPLRALDEPVRVVAAGIEAAAKLRKLPCDVHHELVVRSVSADAELNLDELMDAIGGDRDLLATPFDPDVLAQAPGVFPLLRAFSTGSSGIDGAAVRRTASDWGGRALLEAGIFHMATGSGAKL